MQCCAAHGGTVALHCIAGGVWRVVRRTFASVHAACVMLLVERCTLHAAYDIHTSAREGPREEHYRNTAPTWSTSTASSAFARRSASSEAVRRRLLGSSAIASRMSHS